MASILKVDKLDPQSGTALELGTSGDTVSVPSGATLDISASTLTPPATMPASSGVNLTALNATQLTSGTVPDARFPATLPAASGVNLTSLDAANLGSNTVPTARLGSGTASSSTVLYGDQTYKAEPGGGITEADNWRITSNFTSTSTPAFLTANWERNDSTWFSVLGTGMSESSGIFTFPSTGYWKIEFTWCFSMARDSEISSGHIYITLDDSNYIETFDGNKAGVFVNWINPYTTFNSMNISIIFDVTDVSNDKCKFFVNCPASTLTLSSTVENATSVTFVKLGDT